MKIKHIKPSQYLLTILMLITIVSIGFAVSNGGGSNPPQPLSPQGPPAAPIDGGILFLAVSGIAYGIKKVIKKD